MLLFNQKIHPCRMPRKKFQNISCYCLTLPHKLWKYYILLFQNISCYCLTIQTEPKKKEVTEFQNISCYCLTDLLYYQKHKKDRFQNISCYCLTNDFTSFFNGLFKKTTILCTFPLFFPSAPSIYCFSKKVHISAISNTFSGNHLVKFCTFKYQ